MSKRSVTVGIFKGSYDLVEKYASKHGIATTSIVSLAVILGLPKVHREFVENGKIWDLTVEDVEEMIEKVKRELKL